MAKPKKHNLSFSDEELTGKRAKKLSADVSKAKHNVKPKKQMKIKNNLQFEENKPKPSSKFSTGVKEEIKDMPRKGISGKVHHEIENNADDNVSVEAADKGSRFAEESTHKVKTYMRRKNRKVSDESESKTYEESRPVRRENSEDYTEFKTDNSTVPNKRSESVSEPKSNSYSRWKQKQNIKNEYYTAGKTASASSSATAGEKIKTKAKDTAKDIGNRVVEYVKSNKTAVIIVGGIVLALVVGMSLLGSTGGVLMSSGSGAVSATTYPSEDEEMKNAEAYYKNLETQLSSTISSYESTHSYDEYHYSIDSITHDPYELTSLLTAYSDGAYLANKVQGTEQTIYAYQYSLTQEVKKETRYREETRYYTVTYYYEDGSTSTEIQSFTERVPYTYYICYVTLKNNGIDKAASKMLSSDQYDLYEVYNEVKGNREDLF